jgi:hypothetical protein
MDRFELIRGFIEAEKQLLDLIPIRIQGNIRGIRWRI